MKSIFLTTVVLFLSIHFNFSNYKIPAVESPVLYTSLNKSAVNNNSPGKSDSIVSHTSNHKKRNTKLNREIKNERKRKNEKKWVNKSGNRNLENIKLHKKMKQEGMFAEKGSVHFDFDKAKIKEDNKTFNQVLQIADRLIFDSTLRVSIAGNTDNIGSESYNDRLSYERAKHIKDYLVDLGVSESQIHLSFNGMSDPVSNNDDASGRYENRRVEFVLFAAG